MNGTDFLADTNALIYLLSGNKCMEPFLSVNLFVSVISEMELLSYPDLKDSDERVIKAYLNSCTILTLDRDVKECAIALRKKYRIKLPDAVVAASAMARHVPLLTADKGFMKIKELRLELITPI